MEDLLIEANAKISELERQRSRAEAELCEYASQLAKLKYQNHKLEEKLKQLEAIAKTDKPANEVTEE